MFTGVKYISPKMTTGLEEVKGLLFESPCEDKPRERGTIRGEADKCARAMWNMNRTSCVFRDKRLALIEALVREELEAIDAAMAERGLNTGSWVRTAIRKRLAQ